MATVRASSIGLLQELIEYWVPIPNQVCIVQDPRSSLCTCYWELQLLLLFACIHSSTGDCAWVLLRGASLLPLCMRFWQGYLTIAFRNWAIDTGLAHQRILCPLYAMIGPAISKYVILTEVF
jgi:hypothetical protein